ncbi:hypothetical protein PENSPDRAFT_656893 [Peniophora sp. CONT]|nr:hypothetical protein PENSPDRAFT_656893 [Peniophora sp. CONT]
METRSGGISIRSGAAERRSRLAMEPIKQTPLRALSKLARTQRMENMLARRHPVHPRVRGICLCLFEVHIPRRELATDCTRHFTTLEAEGTLLDLDTDVGGNAWERVGRARIRPGQAHSDITGNTLDVLAHPRRSAHCNVDQCDLTPRRWTHSL